MFAVIVTTFLIIFSQKMIFDSTASALVFFPLYGICLFPYLGLLNGSIDECMFRKHNNTFHGRHYRKVVSTLFSELSLSLHQHKQLQHLCSRKLISVDIIILMHFSEGGIISFVSCRTIFYLSISFAFFTPFLLFLFDGFIILNKK